MEFGKRANGMTQQTQGLLLAPLVTDLFGETGVMDFGLAYITVLLEVEARSFTSEQQLKERFPVPVSI